MALFDAREKAIDGAKGEAKRLQDEAAQKREHKRRSTPRQRLTTEHADCARAPTMAAQLGRAAAVAEAERRSGSRVTRVSHSRFAGGVPHRRAPPPPAGGVCWVLRHPKTTRP
ncbi:MAG: hypothetical protein ABW321_12480, partial [Polyangiales bacterium]